MPLKGEQKRAYQRRYMRGYMRELRAKGRLLRPDVKTPVKLPWVDADGNEIPED